MSRETLAAELAREGVVTEPTRHAQHGLHVVSGSALASDAFKAGLFIVQDEASQLVPELGALRPGARVLDLCAAPGGKTMALAARLDGHGMLVASDVRPRRVRLLSQTLTGLAVPASVVRVSGEGPLPFGAGCFDYVLVDAPCSGLGTVRRDPDIRWVRTPDDLPRMAATQGALLRRAAALVAAGGTIVYATCSSEPDENEDVVGLFVSNTPGFVLRHTHRTLPISHDLEAFYAAVLVRDV
jgi:16S rRNA (cytosine967-C5)-methyltransferase